MEGGRWYQGWFEPPQIRLALARHELGELAEVTPPEFDWDWEPVSTFLDALTALGDRDRIAAEAPKWLQQGSFAEPFALRALGVVHGDRACSRGRWSDSRQWTSPGTRSRPGACSDSADSPGNDHLSGGRGHRRSPPPPAPCGPAPSPPTPARITASERIHARPRRRTGLRWRGCGIESKSSYQQSDEEASLCSNRFGDRIQTLVRQTMNRALADLPMMLESRGAGSGAKSS